MSLQHSRDTTPFSKKGNRVTVIGDEQLGISQSVLNELDHTIHIEMFGTNSSTNVTPAAAIALFELTKS